MSTADYILALDQGTTSSRAILFDREGRIQRIAQKEFKQIYPHSGWVEHDPIEIFLSQRDVAKECLAAAEGKKIGAIGITNQRETTILWDRRTGKPVHNAIVWQDRRTAEICDQMKGNNLETLIQAKTGLLCDAYFSGSKIKWLIDSKSEIRELMHQGNLAFGTVDSWLIWQLSGGKDHVIDITNASRTMLMDIKTGQWDNELLEIFGLDASILPKIVPCSGAISQTDKAVLGIEIPICGIAGDQQAASFGQMCIEPGMAKNTYGTGCFVLMNTGQDLIQSEHRLLSTVAWKLGDKITYALEGSIFIGGAVVQWLRDELQIINSSAEIEQLAATASDNGGVYLVPAFTGLGAPHWDAYARGTIVGLSRGSNKAHIARAALEAIAYQSKDVVEAMESDAKIKLRELRVDGGASINQMLMQFQSNALDCKVIRPQIAETTALGAAYLAGLGSGFWESIDQLKSLWSVARIFEPDENQKQVESMFVQWKKAVNLSKGWLV